jgi:hypothetical protein
MTGFRLVSMARLLVLVIFLMLFMGLATTAFAAPVDLANNLANYTIASSNVSNSQWMAQAFTTTATNTRVTSVVMALCSGPGVAGTYIVEIWNATGAGGRPGSKVADVAANADAASLPSDSSCSASAKTFSGLSIQLAPSTIYYLVARPGAGMLGSLWWHITFNTSGTGFPSNQSYALGGVWAAPYTTAPVIMQVVADTSLAPVAAPTAVPAAPKEVPEGDTLLLLGGGMSGLGVWLRYQWSKRKKVAR